MKPARDKEPAAERDGLAAPAKVTTLTIRSKAGAAAPGESLYGVFAHGASTSLALDDVTSRPAAAASPSAVPWPATAVEQLAAIAALTTQRPVSVGEAGAAFIGSRHDLVARHLETLSLMGEVMRDADGRYAAARKAARFSSE